MCSKGLEDTYESIQPRVVMEMRNDGTCSIRGWFAVETVGNSIQYYDEKMWKNVGVIGNMRFTMG